MQLQPGERSVFAYFNNEENAYQAARLLKEKGYSDLQVSRVANSSRRPQMGDNTSLSALILGDQNYDTSLSSLLAAHPDVSGLAANYDISGSARFLLTVVTLKEKAPYAIQIIKDHGGLI
ncbi:MAG: hypothetical protein ACOX0E_04910 [Syntrophomonadaceae bacterium]|jgi:hypothetical protein